MQWCTHLILDSCVWIDLINKNQENYISILENLVSNGYVILIIPEQVRNEWDKNKEDKINKEKSSQYKSLIEKIKVVKSYAKTTNIKELEDQLSLIDKLLEENKYELLQKFITLTERIELLINHPNNIHLMDTQNVKDKVLEHALKRKAPFKGKQNNIGDALIILSAIEYAVESKTLVYFVSTNHSDFGAKDSTELHDDLKIQNENELLIYFNSIPSALKEIQEISEDIIELVNEEMERQYELERESREILRSISECDCCYRKHDDLMGYYLYDLADVPILGFCEDCYVKNYKR